MANICGIYQILNRVTGKSYVGSSVNIESRWGTHRKHLRGKGHHSIKLQRAWDKYGPDVWEWNILRECKEYALDFLEAYEMTKWNTVNSGYNMVEITLSGRAFSKWTKEDYEKQRVARQSKSKGAKAASLAKQLETKRNKSDLEKLEIILKSNKVKQDKSDEEKAVTKEKTRQTKESKSEEQKAEIEEKRLITRRNWSEEAKSVVQISLKSRYPNRSEEANKLTRAKMSASQRGRPEDEKRASREQASVTWQNRTDEQKVMSLEKGRITRQGKSDEEKAKAKENISNASKLAWAKRKAASLAALTSNEEA